MKELNILYNYQDYYSQTTIQQTESYIRILHASPDAPPVDIYVNEKLIASNIPFKSFTEYYALNPGLYNVKVYPTGQRQNPVIDRDLRVPPNGIYTVAAVNKLSDITLYPILDTPMPIPIGKVYVRFVHLSPDAPNVDVKLADGTTLFEDVEYKEVTDYILANPGTYAFNVYPTGTNQSVLYVPNQTLKGNRFYSIYAVGLADGEPPLQALTPLDGNSYLTVY